MLTPRQVASRIEDCKRRQSPKNVLALVPYFTSQGGAKPLAKPRRVQVGWYSPTNRTVGMTRDASHCVPTFVELASS